MHSPIRTLAGALVVLGAVAGPLSALPPSATPTATPIPTAVATATPSVTPGSGTYAYNLATIYGQPLAACVPGNSYNVLYITYTANAQIVGGTLTFVLPSDIGAPNAGNFVVSNNPPGAVDAIANNPVVNGNTISFGVNSLGPGESVSTVTFEYGYPNGFYFGPTTQTTEAFQVWSSLTPGAQGGQVPTPAIPLLPVQTATVSPTVSPTPTITVSPTISPTFTVSPTNTVSPTVTVTSTSTPIGPVHVTGFYTYPNPFDKRVVPQVTIRFQPTAENVQITIFNLVGNPVRDLPSSLIQGPSGYANWNGDDDYGRQVPGGLYFVRLKTPSKTQIHKMTVYY